MVSQIRQRLEALRALPFSDLQALPAWKSEETFVEGVSAGITTYREGSGSETLKIIVQFSTKPERFLLIFRFRQVLADGFEVRPDGTVLNVPASEIHGFM